LQKKCRLRNHLIPYIRKKYTKKKKKNLIIEEEEEVEEDYDISILSGCKEWGLVPVKRKQSEILVLNDSNDDDDVGVGYEGATVLRPHPGVHLNPIPVADFGSLYPSCMIARNLSHEMLVKDPKYNNLPGWRYYDVMYYTKDPNIKDKNERKKAPFIIPNKCRFAKKMDGTMGIIPEILKELLDTRSATKRAMKKEKDPFKKNVLNGKQLALKITANSVYGQTGARTSAISLKEIAACTTATGREMLNNSRVFTEHIYPRIIETVKNKNWKLYKKRMHLLFNKKIEKLLGNDIIEKLKKTHYKDNLDPKNNTHLKKSSDYYYLNILQERYIICEDKDFINEELGITCKNDFIRYLYIQLRKLMKKITVDPFCVYGDTDSIFIDFRIKNEKTGKYITDKSALDTAIKLCVHMGDLINYLLPKPQKLNYEKTFHPWISSAKKMYTGYLYEFDTNKYYLKNMGIVLKRRDNAPIVKIVVGGIVHSILKYRSAKKAVEFTSKVLKDILSGKYSDEKFIISKTIKGPGLTKSERDIENKKPKEERIYKNRSSLVHVAVADRMADRDPGSKPQSNDRIPFVYVVTNKKVKLQGDRAENIDYVREHNLDIDYLFYIERQIMKPSIQFLEKLVKDPFEETKDEIIDKELSPTSDMVEGSYNVESTEEEYNSNSYSSTSNDNTGIMPFFSESSDHIFTHPYDKTRERF